MTVYMAFGSTGVAVVSIVVFVISCVPAARPTETAASWPLTARGRRSAPVNAARSLPTVVARFVRTEASGGIALVAAAVGGIGMG